MKFLLDNWSLIAEKLLTHVYLSSLAMTTALCIGVSLGVVLANKRKARTIILSFASVTQTIPSLAAMAILIPIFGIGATPTLIILTFYGVYPILKNTVLGIHNIPRETLEAAFAIGLNRFERLFKVELPLALPSIVAGVRIASAMIIGIATIAAFIGAGGLGDFITQGLALNDMRFIFLGAIPAAMLALICDAIISSWERSLLRKQHEGMSCKKVIIIIMLVLSTLLIGFFYRFINQTNNTVVVASKNFTEQYILAEIIAQLIEAKSNLKVVRKINLGTTDAVHQALMHGDVDIYAEYTGTAYWQVLHEETPKDARSMFDYLVQRYHHNFNLRWLLPFGFSNTQTLAIKKDLALRHNIKSLSDLATIAPLLTIGAPAEFIVRKDAWPSLKAHYGLDFKSIKSMDPNLMYTAIHENYVDVIVAFATDAKLASADLVPLIDDKKVACAYEAAPIIRGEILERHPELKLILMQIAGTIDRDTMTNMNKAVLLEQKTPAKMAREFIESLASKEK